MCLLWLAYDIMALLSYEDIVLRDTCALTFSVLNGRLKLLTFVIPYPSPLSLLHLSPYQIQDLQSWLFRMLNYPISAGEARQWKAVGCVLAGPAPSLHLWFLGVAEDCCMLSILLAVPSCFNSFWHGVIPTSYLIFNTCIYRDHQHA